MPHLCRLIVEFQKKKKCFFLNKIVVDINHCESDIKIGPAATRTRPKMDRLPRVPATRERVQENLVSLYEEAATSLYDMGASRQDTRHHLRRPHQLYIRTLQLQLRLRSEPKQPCHYIRRRPQASHGRPCVWEAPPQPILLHRRLPRLHHHRLCQYGVLQQL